MVAITADNQISANLFAYVNNNPVKNVDPSGFGIKSKAVTKIAKLLLKSGDELVDFLRELGLLDKAAAKSFKKVTGNVGDFVKTLEYSGGHASAIARQELPSLLSKWGIKDKGTQQMIANAVSYAIKMAEWVIL